MCAQRFERELVKAEYVRKKNEEAKREKYGKKLEKFFVATVDRILGDSRGRQEEIVALTQKGVRNKFWVVYSVFRTFDYGTEELIKICREVMERCELEKRLKKSLEMPELKVRVRVIGKEIRLILAW